MQHEKCFTAMVGGISRQFLMTLFLSLLKELKFWGLVTASFQSSHQASSLIVCHAKEGPA